MMASVDAVMCILHPSQPCHSVRHVTLSLSAVLDDVDPKRPCMARHVQR